MKTYGQNSEDIAIQSYFDSIQQYSGRVLDIGAFDGITFSNSRALIEQGWRGVLVEADFGNAENCRKNNIGHDTLTLCAAVDPHDTGIKTFYSSNGDMVGTTEENHRNKWAKDVKFNECLVMSVSVLTLFHQFNDTFDFINIDVEGVSSEIAKVMIPMYKNCKVICIEHDNEADYLRSLCRQYGYTKELLFNGENLIMAR